MGQVVGFSSRCLTSRCSRYWAASETFVRMHRPKTPWIIGVVLLILAASTALSIFTIQAGIASEIPTKSETSIVESIVLIIVMASAGILTIKKHAFSFYAFSILLVHRAAILFLTGTNTLTGFEFAFHGLVLVVFILCALYTYHQFYRIYAS